MKGERNGEGKVQETREKEQVGFSIGGERIIFSFGCIIPGNLRFCPSLLKDLYSEHDGC